MSQTTTAPQDERTGWSVHCKAGNFKTCDDLKFRCANPQHRGSETAKQRSERLLAEAHAARTGNATTDVVPAPTDAVPKKTPHFTTQLRGQVLAALIREGGEVEHSGGRASWVLMQTTDYDGGLAAFTQLMLAMGQDGLIDREIRGTKTFRISITDAGERVAHELGVVDEAPLPRQPAPVPSRPKLVDVSAAKPVAARPKPIRSRDGGRQGACPSTAPRDPRDPKIDLVFEDPPKRQNGRRPLEDVLEQEGVFDALRARPGDWARLISYGGGGGASGAVKKLRKVDALADFEFVAKRPPRSTSSDVVGSILYARFVGNTNSSQTKGQR